MSTTKTAFALSGTKTALLLLSLFVIWGMGQHYYYTMMPQVAERFHLHGATALLSSNILNLVYLACALPAAVYARRLGYKAAILCGLGCISIGCFTLYPAVALHATGCYLFAVAALAAGWVFLEVTANPLVANLGPADGFVWRLNLAQAVYPIGSMAAIFVAYWLLGTYLFQSSAKFVFSFINPYILLGAAVFVIAYWFEDTRFPPVATARQSGGELAQLRRLLSDRFLLCAMVAQGLGIVILVFDGVKIVGGGYLLAAIHCDLPGPLGEAYFWATVAFATGRFVGVGLMKIIAPARLLALFALGGCVSSLLATSGWTLVAGGAVLANQFFAALLWPTILGLAIRGKGSSMQLATALICIGSALGGALAQQTVTAWQDIAIAAGMFVPAASFLAISGFAWLALKREAGVVSRHAAAVAAHS